MRRKLTRFVIISICVVFSLSMVVALYLRSMQPKHKGELALAGLKEETEVLFDKWAIPHIYAKSEHDAYFSLGYLHAQDRLFQMEIMRRLGRGELAEILGPELIKYDSLFRTLGTHRIAARLAEKLSPDSPEGQAIAAYVAGVNEFIKTGTLPLEFKVLGMQVRPFESTDSFAIAAYMAFSFVKALRSDPLFAFIHEKLGPEFLKDVLTSEQLAGSSFRKSPDLAVLESFTAFAKNWDIDAFTGFEGSNGWVISGRWTRSGKTMLANDPHINFSSPSVWYEAHMEIPNFSLYGHYLAGVPVALLGHNEKQGWGITMLQNDGMDFFQEKVNPENAQQVWFKDHWENIETHTEIIKIKGQPDLKIDVRSTRHGPIVNNVIDGLKRIQAPVAITWDFLDEDNEIFQSFYQLARSESVEDAEHAVGLIHSPGLNVTYANAKGDIAWWTAARFPIRSAASEEQFILDGSSGEHEYLGYHSFESHPKLINPPEGFIVSANQDPFTNHPYKVRGYYNPDYRYDTLRERLPMNKQWSVEGVKALQLETQIRIYRRILDRLLPLVEDEASKDPIARDAHFLLSKWDFRHAIDENAPTVFHEFMGQLTEKIFRPRLTESFFDAFRHSNRIHDTLIHIMENPESPWWQDKEGKVQQKESVIAAWNDAIRALKESLGSNPRQWNWGRVHTVAHKHLMGRNAFLGWLMNIGPVAASGSVEAVNNLYFLIGPGLHEVEAGPSTRRVIDFANPLESWGINPTGQSGYFANSHYRDQAALYHQGEYRLQLMDRKALADAKRLALRPKTL